MNRLICVSVVFIVMLTASAAYDYGTYKEAYDAGKQKAKVKDYVGAKADFMEALKLAASGEEKAAARLRIADTDYFGWNYPAARAEYAKVLKIAEATPAQKSKAQFQIGCTHFFHEKDFARARAEYAKVLKISGANLFYRSSAQLQIGCSYFCEGKNPAAVTEFTKVLAMPKADAKDKFKSRIKQHKSQAKEFVEKIKSGTKGFSLK